METQEKLKKVILISNHLFEYRLRIYEGFYELFYNKGIEFKVYALSLNMKLPNFAESKLSIQTFNDDYRSLKSIIVKENPNVIINFLHLSNKTLWYLYLIASKKGIPTVYWNHGINLQDPKNIMKNQIFKFIHNISTSIILYSENELKYISMKNRKKVFIANNTLNYNYFPEIIDSKEEIRTKYGVKYDKNVLFVGRIEKRKKLDFLIDIFSKSDFENYGLIIVGSNLDTKSRIKISSFKNILYLGSIYDDHQINEIFKMSDLFCIPGTNGLGINQAMYWGLPCITTKCKHSPEIIYLIDEYNGKILNDKMELEKYIAKILNDDSLLKMMSQNARNHINKSASFEGMFRGFLESVNYVLDGKY